MHAFRRGAPVLPKPVWLLSLLAAACLQPTEKVAGLSDQDPGNSLAVALAVPSNFSEITVVSGLASPTAMEFAPDGRLFVCEQAGRLRVIKAGTLLSTPFLTVTTTSAGERGLLGVAFDPDFSVDRYVYVYYTATSPNIHNRLSRFRVSASNPDVAEAGSETVLLDLDPLSSATNHNGGAIHFGADGKLYVAVGDNFAGNSQSLGNLLGKMLRLNKDGTIPSDNPFYGSATGKYRAIWAYGLRNPFTFAFQPGSGRMFINDVGESRWEEINDGLRGGNLGWPITEGPTSDARFQTPFHAYSTGGDGCAITGGAFYNPAIANFPPEYVGDYFFADYCGGWIRRIDLASKAVSVFATGRSEIADLKVASDGSLWYVQRLGGTVRRITYSGSGSQAPVIGSHPQSLTVSTGQAASFSVTASGTAPLAYRWQRNGVDIPGATAPTYSLASAQAGDNGARFRAIVGNASGSATSNEAVLTVTSNQPPAAAITAPAAGSLFSGGQAITYAGTGTDPETGSLPGSAFTWQVDLHHDTHYHPFMPPTIGSATGGFTIPTRGETSPNIWYRIHLTVRDPGGLTHSVFRDIQPRKADVTLATVPAGLQLRLDGQPVTTPHTFTGVVGIIRSLEAVSPQSSGGRTWNWSTWSDGGARVHEIPMPSANTTFTATFAEGAVAETRYEAENAVFSGPNVMDYYTGYTGRGYLDFWHDTEDYVEWTVNVAAAGTRQLDFRYALGSGMSRPLAIRVNGVLVASSLDFPVTGSWTTWSTRGLPASLNAGNNTVRATAIRYSGPNIDNLTVR